ncbi:META domain-containing protein [Aliiroseovarius subalbicans]|uniref:META domain-containing protein n=1 Tax=Aliiroseovarius subalbicans TaxID=2925840 RepID=UPI001F58A370|nr:META domain-containing protein [Aliiroseovarius subalbicans]MCI2399718.1 META domain-containing protein [Aliiroseovarius subalbicans]
MRALLAAIALAALASCEGDETISGYSDTKVTWVLEELDGVPFTARATITFPEEGKIAGEAPCNRYFGAQTAPYPWFDVDGVGATRMACPDLDAEGRFFAALERVTLAEVAGNTLILSTEDRVEMVFKAQP